MERKSMWPLACGSIRCSRRPLITRTLCATITGPTFSNWISEMQTMRRTRSMPGFAKERGITSSRSFSLVFKKTLFLIFLRRRKGECFLYVYVIEWCVYVCYIFLKFEISFLLFTFKSILLSTFNVSGTLDANVQMLLTSALYFKGRWLKSFDRGATRVGCFQVPDGSCQNIPMMQNIAKYRYGYVAALDADVVEIPYSVRLDSCFIDKINKSFFCIYIFAFQYVLCRATISL